MIWCFAKPWWFHRRAMDRCSILAFPINITTSHPRERAFLTLACLRFGIKLAFFFGIQQHLQSLLSVFPPKPRLQSRCRSAARARTPECWFKSVIDSKHNRLDSGSFVLMFFLVSNLQNLGLFFFPFVQLFYWWLPQISTITPFLLT